MPMRNVHVGELRHRLTIQTPTAAAPGTYGEQALTWTTYATVWGKVEPVSGSERYSMAQERADVTHVVTIRYCGGITTNMRVVFTCDGVTHTMNIRGVLTEEYRATRMTLLCTEEDANSIAPESQYHVLTFSWADDTTAAADSATLDVSTAFTVEFWMRPAIGTIPATQVMIAKWGADASDQAFYIALNSAGKLVIGLCKDATGYTWTSTAAVISDVAWHRYAVAYDGEAITASKDGTAIAGSGDIPERINTGAADVCVGNRNSAGGFSFFGSLACIRIWNTARTEQQIADSATKIQLGATSGLVAEWTSAASDSLTLPDRSGNSNALILGTGATKPVLTAAYALPVAGGAIP